MQAVTTSTKELAAATRELEEALLGDNGQLVDATQQLEKYRKELDYVKNASAVTAQQLRKAQEDLDQSQAQNLNYRTILDEIASGKRDKNGDIIVEKPPAGNSGANPDNGGNRSFHVGDMVGFHGWYNYSSWGAAPAGN